MVRRTCAECRNSIPCKYYSNNQWSKGIGESRCNFCVHGEGNPDLRPNTLRYNRSERFQVNLNDVWKQGGFKYVCIGRYIGGRRHKQPCAVKYFIHHQYDNQFHTDIKTSIKAGHILEGFNGERVINKPVQLNVPEVKHVNNSAVLLEPFIRNWEKFNSNSGWYSGNTDWNNVMQALSHYSYHKSGGQSTLCDLQGGVYSHGVILSDPVILSRQQGRYGPTDLGAKGIKSFFYRHRCNKYCSNHWQLPNDCQPYYPVKEGTSMEIKNVPTRHSRPSMTFSCNAIFEDEYDSDSSDEYFYI